MVGYVLAFLGIIAVAIEASWNVSKIVRTVSSGKKAEASDYKCMVGALARWLALYLLLLFLFIYIIMFNSWRAEPVHVWCIALIISGFVRRCWRWVYRIYK